MAGIYKSCATSRMTTDKTMNKIKFAHILLVLISCSDKTTNRVSLRHADDLNVKVLLAESLTTNDTTYVPVIIDNNKYSLWLAFYDHRISDTTTLDTSVRFSTGHVHLMISGDTAKYWLPTKSQKGNFKCDDVSLIVRDNNNNFYFKNVTFDYHVKK